MFDLATGRRPSCDQHFGWLQEGCRVVARRLATGRRPVTEGCRDDLVARRFWLLQVKPLCDQIDRREVFVGRRQVADWSPTSCCCCKQSPIGSRPISKKLQSFCNKKTLKIQSPTSRRPIANRLPIAPQLILDWLSTDHRRVDSHSPITRHYSINTRSSSAPEPILDLFSVSSSDINLTAVSWRQFFKYFKHRLLKIDLKITHLIFRSNLILDCLVWNIGT